MAQTSSQDRRTAFLALLLTVPVPSLGTAAGMIVAPGTTAGGAVFLASKVWISVVPLVWLFLVDKGRWSWSRPARGGLGTGLALGLAIGAVIVVAYFGLGTLLLDRETMRTTAHQIGLADRGAYIGGAVYWVCVNSLLEEYFWRWFVYSKSEVLMPPGFAVPVSALCFTVHHVVALQVYLGMTATLVTAVGVFAAGAVWSWCYRRYRSVWPGYVSHAVVDVSVFAIGYLLIFG